MLQIAKALSILLKGRYLACNLFQSLQAFDKEGNLIDLDTCNKLDAIFDDFRIFVKMTEKLQSAQELLRKEAENFDWESL